jgi:gluconolactonase
LGSAHGAEGLARLGRVGDVTSRPPRTAEPLPVWVEGVARARAANRAGVIESERVSARIELEDVELVADDLAVPEGPVALDDGSVLFVEIRRGTLDRVDAAGNLEIVAFCAGGPNGVAIGPDGAAYVCNNGRSYPNYEGGRIERVDLDTGEVEIVCTSSDRGPLRRPNDLVFDDAGGLWFTDFGGVAGFDDGPYMLGSIHYVAPGATTTTVVLGAVHDPNGIGLSRDGTTLYFSQTVPGRAYRRSITGPGAVEHARDPDPESLVCGLGGLQMFDGLAVDADDNLCLATLVSGCITVAAPDGSACVQLMFPPAFRDSMTTNICFAKDGTAFITQGETGRLVRCPWPRTRELVGA